MFYEKTGELDFNRDAFLAELSKSYDYSPEDYVAATFYKVISRKTPDLPFRLRARLSKDNKQAVLFVGIPSKDSANRWEWLPLTRKNRQRQNIARILFGSGKADQLFGLDGKKYTYQEPPAYIEGIKQGKFAYDRGIVSFEEDTTAQSKLISPAIRGQEALYFAAWLEGWDQAFKKDNPNSTPESKQEALYKRLEMQSKASGSLTLAQEKQREFEAVKSVLLGLSFRETGIDTSTPKGYIKAIKRYLERFSSIHPKELTAFDVETEDYEDIGIKKQKLRVSLYFAKTPRRMIDAPDVLGRIHRVPMAFLCEARYYHTGLLSGDTRLAYDRLFSRILAILWSPYLTDALVSSVWSNLPKEMLQFPRWLATNSIPCKKNLIYQKICQASDRYAFPVHLGLYGAFIYQAADVIHKNFLTP